LFDVVVFAVSLAVLTSVCQADLFFFGESILSGPRYPHLSVAPFRLFLSISNLFFEKNVKHFFSLFGPIRVSIHAGHPDSRDHVANRRRPRVVFPFPLGVFFSARFTLVWSQRKVLTQRFLSPENRTNPTQPVFLALFCRAPPKLPALWFPLKEQLPLCSPPPHVPPPKFF